MYMPFYNFNAPAKSIESTQNVLSTIKSTHIIAFFFTAAAILCDLGQMRYFADLTLNDDFFSSMSVTVIVVLGLDVSMFLLGLTLNQYRKGTGEGKKTFMFVGIGLLCVFGAAYLIYILLALPVLLQQAAEGEMPFYGRLLIPAGSSLLSFFSSVGWNPRGEQIQRLNDEKLKIESDIASAQNTLKKIDRDFAEFDAMRYENAQAVRAFDLLLSKVQETSQEARMLLVQEIGSPEAADALLSQVVSPDAFWETARVKISTKDELFPDEASSKEIPTDFYAVSDLTA